MKTEEKKSKGPLIGGIVVLVALFFGIWGYRYFSSPERKTDDRVVGGANGKNVGAAKPQPEAPLPIMPNMYAYPPVTTSMANIVWIKNPAGYNIEFDPEDNCAYNMYIDDGLSIRKFHYPAAGAPGPRPGPVNVQGNHRRGFQVEPGQRIQATHFRICVHHYTVAAPPDWLSRAMATQGN